MINRRNLLRLSAAAVVASGAAYTAMAMARRAPLAERYQRLTAKYSARSRLDDDKTGREAARRFLAIAREDSDGPIAFNALKWIVLNTRYSPEAAEAMELLAADHKDDLRTADLLRQADLLRSDDFKPLEDWAAAVLSKSARPDVRAEACLLVAMQAKRRLERIERAEFQNKLARSGAADVPHELIEPMSAKEKERLTAEGAAKFQRVVEEFGWLPYVDFNGRKRTFGTVARSEKERLPMQPAPDVREQGFDGNSLNLSDFRGRVVLLSFTAEWTGEYDRLRKLAARFENKPFAVLTVSIDDDKASLRQAIKDRLVTWKCWWERGGGLGPVCTQWNVRSFPTTYLLDAKGRIRFKDLHHGAVSPAVEMLMKEAEAK